MRVGAAGFTPNGEIAGHSWNNDRTAFAFGVRNWGGPGPTIQEIWIVNLAGVTDPTAVPPEAFQLLVSGNGVGWPDWSPDGRRIGYVSWDGTVVYEVATGRKKTLKRTPSTSWGRTIWSPTSAYFVVYHWDNFLNGYDAIYRFTADLGGKTELTAGLNNPIPDWNVLIPVGWRD